MVVGQSRKANLQLKHRLGLTLAAAVLYVLSFDPFGLWPLAWIALVPLILALRGANPTLAFRLGMLFGVVVFGILLHWFVTVFGLFGVLLPLVPALFMGLFALMHAVSQRRPAWLRIVFAPVFWVGLEFFRSELWCLRFSWLTPAYSQYSQPVLIQTAQLLGCYGVTFFIVAFNVLLAEYVIRVRESKSLKYLASALALFALVAGYGLLRTPAEGTQEIPFAAVQSERGFETCLALSKKHLQEHGKPKLFVWPEYAARLDVMKEARAKETITGFCREQGVSLIFGTTETAQGDDFYNTALLINADGEVAGKYVKAYPVQFFRDGIPGDSREPLGGNLGILICYDLSYPEVARNLVRNGASVLIAPTMDACYWGYWPHLQHAALAPLRAVETRRWLVRAASSGISMLVSPDGTVRKTLGYAEEGVLAGKYGRNTQLTPYVKFGYLFSWLCLLATAAFACAAQLYSLLSR